MATLAPHRPAQTHTGPEVDLEAMWQEELPPCKVEYDLTCELGHDHGHGRCGKPSVAVAHLVCPVHGEIAEPMPVCAEHVEYAKGERDSNPPCPGRNGEKRCPVRPRVEFS